MNDFESDMGGDMMQNPFADSAEEKVMSAKVAVSTDFPFLSHLLNYVEIVETEKIPTAAVTENGLLLYNPDFMANISREERAGVLVHEVSHLSLLTFPRARGRDMEKWNIASDLFINYQVNNQQNIKMPEKMPEEVDLGQFDTQDRDESTDSDFYVPNKNGKYTFKDGETTIDVTEQTSEEIYDVIPEEEDGSGSMDQMISEDDMVISPGEDGNVTIELPNGEEIEVPAEAIEQEKDWEEINNEAQHTQDAMGRGDAGGGFEDVIQSRDNNVVDWKRHLYATTQNHLPSGYTWQKPSLSTVASGPYLPGRSQDKELEVIACIDTSGSVSDDLLSTFIGELGGLVSDFSRVNLTIIYHDAEVQEVYEYENASRSDVEEQEISGRGGTDHIPVFEYIQENYMARENNTLVVNLTDGYTKTPNKSEFPRFDKCLWIIPNYDVDMDRLTSGTIVRVTPDQYS